MWSEAAAAFVLLAGGGVYTTSTPPTLCSDERSPRVCMSTTLQVSHVLISGQVLVLNKHSANVESTHLLCASV